MLLPCNVVIYTGDDDKTAVMVMDPFAALSMIGNLKILAFGKSCRKDRAGACRVVTDNATHSELLGVKDWR